MNKAQAINQIYPELTYEDFMVFDIGNGQEIEWYNKEIIQPTEEELEDARKEYCCKVCKEGDLKEFSTFESDIQKIKKTLENCTAYITADNCSEDRKARIGLQEADLTERLSDTETLRNNKLDYLISTYSDGTTEGDSAIISEINDLILGNI